MPDTHALIVNSGSTNTCPYTIDVTLNSFATYTVCQRHGSGTLDVTKTISFFDHVLKARPLDELPYKPCLKPISYATVTDISYAQQKSPDISCPSHDSRVTQLYDDAVSIQNALGFSTIRRPQSLPVNTIQVPDSQSMVAPRYGKQTAHHWLAAGSLGRKERPCSGDLQRSPGTRATAIASHTSPAGSAPRG
ncbi:hypothetical protein KDH_71500 [Dictyobacter sp. S3.2.2.5]|uniref:Uncharacterized protein n=2 Tax=Dictyobacter halimunensis TaxID=3026934 RepID=A0ABQ6G5E8_9CHLR|nr:hypothetical protein KDH_71500 [Dictyobacter sp. S3.2.2.5]